MGKDRYLRTSQSAFSAGSESGDTRGPDRAHKKKKARKECKQHQTSQRTSVSNAKRENQFVFPNRLNQHNPTWA